MAVSTVPPLANRLSMPFLRSSRQCYLQRQLIGAESGHITPVACHAVNFGDGGLIGHLCLKASRLSRSSIFLLWVKSAQLQCCLRHQRSRRSGSKVQRVIIIYLNRFFTAADILQAKMTPGLMPSATISSSMLTADTGLAVFAPALRDGPYRSCS